jgi:hypothetical protein
MFLFFDPPGCGDSVCSDPMQVGPADWEAPRPLRFANSEALRSGGAHKPFVVQDPHRPNRAAKYGGRYCLLVVSWDNGHKVVQQAWAEKLAGPWVVDPDILIPLGAEGEFDEKHVDAVTGYYFADRDEWLYFYMGYPEQPQPREISPMGSSQAVAVRKSCENRVTKLGQILAPCQTEGHWASGWVGGCQLLPGRKHRWAALLNASPTAPFLGDTNVFRQEPPPSLGGFAYTDADWPISGWQFEGEPLEWIEAVPQAALDNGEGFNLWRHNLLALPGDSAAIFYNSGYYGKEQLYMIRTDRFDR